MDADATPLLEIVLVEPEIPPNAGNVIRLAANAGARLHFVEPLGFTVEDRQLRRAGLDYHDLARVQRHADWSACRAALGDRRLFAFSTRGTRRHTEVRYAAGDVLVFGRETKGLDDAVLAQFSPAHRLRLPMRPSNRSINLSNAVAIAVFEAWRQLGFRGAAP